EAALWRNGGEGVVGMGGYNTVCEVLSFGKRALIVPRVGPRREQHIRAERLQELGLVDVLEGENLNAAAISQWMARELPPLQIEGRLNLNGLARLPGLALQILAGSAPDAVAE